jgi:hypothetical protein
LIISGITLVHNLNHFIPYGTTFTFDKCLLCCLFSQIDAPMENEQEWKAVISSFTVVRKIEGGIFPIGYKKALSDWNSRTGYTLVLESRYIIPLSILNRTTFC